MESKYEYWTPLDLGIKKGTIEGPAGGWEPQLYYVVEVAFNEFNPIHRAIFYSGFISKGMPCGYNELLKYDGKYTIEDVYFLKVIAALDIKSLSFKCEE